MTETFNHILNYKSHQVHHLGLKNKVVKVDNDELFLNHLLDLQHSHKYSQRRKANENRGQGENKITELNKLLTPICNNIIRPHLSVNHHFRGILKSSKNQIKRLLSADRMSVRLSKGGNNGKEKKINQEQLIIPPQILSNKSTGYSTQSQEQILRKENQQIKQLCAVEAERLLRLQKEINSEVKMQAIRRQLYQHSIKNLRRIANLPIDLSETDQNQQYEECESLSITSK